jgi:hypothetical protein
VYVRSPTYPDSLWLAHRAFGFIGLNSKEDGADITSTWNYPKCAILGKPKLGQTSCERDERSRKTLGHSAAQRVAVVGVLQRWHIVHVFTKQFLDRVNFSPSYRLLRVLYISLFLSRLEAQGELKFVAVIAASIAILVIVGWAWPTPINMIAGEWMKRSQKHHQEGFR